MIKKIRIENFRCIRELEMDLEPLTVLVGPNASGKSTVLAALALQGWQSPDQSVSGRGRITWQDDQGRAMHLLPNIGAPPGSLPVIQQFQLELRAMRQPNTVQPARLLESTGANLANVFATLPRRKQAEIAADLTKLVDALADVDIRPVGQGKHHFVFQDRWNPKRWFTPDQVSDGTMLVLALLVLQHNEHRPHTICLEEPERGLHPYLLGQVIDVLRAISQGKHGPPTQFVLATQSAELLDHVQPHEVRFLERDAEGGVQARTAPVDDEAWANAIHEYENSVGQMWLSGSLGGVPGTY
jgi:predicted ATPase